MLGWGGSFEPSDMSELGEALDKIEKSTAKLFDRWSITVSGKASNAGGGGGGSGSGGGGEADGHVHQNHYPTGMLFTLSR